MRRSCQTFEENMYAVAELSANDSVVLQSIATYAQFQ